jgi:putative oxidoreductase
MPELRPEIVAPFFARVILGILFMVQGYDKIFNIGTKTVIQTITPTYRKRHLPQWMINMGAYFTSYVEFVCGIFLIAGLLKFFSLYMLGLDLIVVSFGMSTMNPVWNLKDVFPRLLLLLFLLLYPAQLDMLSLEHLISQFK